MSQHVVPVRVYIAVFVALLVLTFATVAAARVDLGEPVLFGIHLPLNITVAVAIAVIKAALVVLFFMHVKYSGRLIQIVVAAAFVWLFIMLGITIADYWARPVLEAPITGVHNPI